MQDPSPCHLASMARTIEGMNARHLLRTMAHLPGRPMTDAERQAFVHHAALLFDDVPVIRGIFEGNREAWLRWAVDTAECQGQAKPLQPFRPLVGAVAVSRIATAASWAETGEYPHESSRKGPGG